MNGRYGSAALILPLTVLACAAGLPEPVKAPTDSVVVTAAERPRGQSPYAGPTFCVKCHETLLALWSATAHAESFRTLEESGEAANPACLRCHTTGFGEWKGFEGRESTPGLAGVTCEACHGPSGDHAGSAYPALVSTAYGRDCASCEVGRICRRCHTRKSSPDFVLSSALESIPCAVVKTVPSTTVNR
jgi:hypothetical protein